jgi:hypothetical protein
MLLVKKLFVNNYHFLKSQIKLKKDSGEWYFKNKQ